MSTTSNPNHINVPPELAQLELERQRLAQEWSLCARDPHKASPESKYDRYQLKVDHNAGDRAMEINLKSFQRPHMRALHCAWISFFLAFTIWFAPAPLLKEIRQDLGLSKKGVWTSSITSDLTAIFTRMVIGPVCDAYVSSKTREICLAYLQLTPSLIIVVRPPVSPWLPFYCSRVFLPHVWDSSKAPEG